jgi:hypothetical protein
MAALRGLRGTAEVDHWVDRLLLTEHAGTRLADLSKGTAQKVGLAQALLVSPALLVLDEPWEGLDAVARTLIPDIVAEITGNGGAVLVSDHRGEIAGLPGAIRWTVAEGTVRPETDTDSDEVIVEVAVRRADTDDAMAQLRADGHRVLGVRASQSPGPADDRPGPDAAGRLRPQRPGAGTHDHRAGGSRRHLRRWRQPCGARLRVLRRHPCSRCSSGRPSWSWTPSRTSSAAWPG